MGAQPSVARAQHFEHLAGALPSRRLVEGERAIDRLDDCRLDPGNDLPERWSGLSHARKRDVHGDGAFVNPSSRNRPKEDCTDCEEIRSRIDFIRQPTGLLGGHVPGRAHDHAGGGRDERQHSIAHACETEVQELGVPQRRDEDVARLDVAMDDTALVRRLEHLEHLRRDSDCLDGRQSSTQSGERPGERLAGEQFHDKKRTSVFRDVVVENRQGPRVVDLVGDVTLAQEALAHLRVERDVRMQELDGGAAPVTVRDFVYRAHPPHFEETVDAPLAVERSSDAPQRSFVQIASAAGHAFQHWGRAVPASSAEHSAARAMCRDGATPGINSRAQTLGAA